VGTRWLDDDEARMWRAFLEMHRNLQLVLERQLNEHGLSDADYTVLVPLSEGPRAGLRARDLRAAAGWDRSRLSHQLRRMEQRGLIARTECETDARGTMVQLTEQGRRAVGAAAPGHVGAVRECFVDLLAPAEVSTLTDVFTRVRDAAAGADDDGA
jgi:DNA-binding MarR family transcriptional regulator